MPKKTPVPMSAKKNASKKLKAYPFRFDRQSGSPITDKPAIGWKEGFLCLMRARCPYCFEPMHTIEGDEQGTMGLTWFCDNNCVSRLMNKGNKS